VTVYLNSFQGQILFDDIGFLVENPAVHRLWPIWGGGDGPRPLTALTFALNFVIGGSSPWGFHLINLTIHVGAALCLYGIIRRTLMRPPLGERYGRAAPLLTLAAALLWAVHPLQTQAVTYIWQRSESLMGLLYLFTLYAAIRGIGGPPGWRVAAVMACAAAMCAKSVAVTAPLLVFLYDRAFLSGSFREAWRRSRWMYAGLAATWGVMAALLIAYPPVHKSAGFGVESVTPWQYALAQPNVILHYLRLAFWPDALCLDYDWPAARGLRDALPGGIVIGALAAATLWASWRAPRAGFLGLWFFGVLGPTSSFMPILDVCFEHRMYLPLAAVTAGAAIGAWELARRPAGGAFLARHGRPVGMAALVLAAVALGWRTRARNADYADPVRMWNDVLRQRPANSRAWDHRGLALDDLGREKEAISSFRRAIEIDPSSAPALSNLARVLSRRGEHEAAIACYRRAVEIAPRSVPIRHNLSIVLQKAGRDAEAERELRETLRLDPRHGKACASLGRLLARQGRRDEALRFFERAAEIHPNSPTAWSDLGSALAALGRNAEAERCFREVLRLKPGDAEAMRRLDFIRAELERTREKNPAER